jgi:hypothetical protein
MMSLSGKKVNILSDPLSGAGIVGQGIILNDLYGYDDQLSFSVLMSNGRVRLFKHDLIKLVDYQEYFGISDSPFGRSGTNDTYGKPYGVSGTSGEQVLQEKEDVGYVTRDGDTETTSFKIYNSDNDGMCSMNCGMKEFIQNCSMLYLESVKRNHDSLREAAKFANMSTGSLKKRMIDNGIDISDWLS